jgi:hypothetical protein
MAHNGTDLVVSRWKTCGYITNFLTPSRPSPRKRAEKAQYLAKLRVMLCSINPMLQRACPLLSASYPHPSRTLSLPFSSSGIGPAPSGGKRTLLPNRPCILRYRILTHTQLGRKCQRSYLESVVIRKTSLALTFYTLTSIVFRTVTDGPQ